MAERAGLLILAVLLSGGIAAAAEKPVSTLPESIVRAEAPGYSSASAQTASKTDVPVSLTPASVYVLNRPLIDDRGSKSLVEVLRTVPGVNAASARLSTLDSLSRGF